MKIGVFSVLFGNKPFEETLDYLVELGVEAVEIGTGAYPGNAHCEPRALLRSERRLKEFREADSPQRPDHQRPQLSRQPAASAGTHRARSSRVFLQTLELAQTPRRVDGDHLQRLPRRRSERHAAELDRVAMAAGVFSDAGVAVEGTRHAVLEGHRPRSAAPAGVRVAIEMHPNFVRLQPRDDDAAARDRAARDRLQLRSESHVLAGRRHRHGHPRPRRRHLSRACQGLPHRSRRT